jgi:hypothetical protein
MMVNIRAMVARVNSRRPMEIAMENFLEIDIFFTAFKPS